VKYYKIYLLSLILVFMLCSCSYPLIQFLPDIDLREKGIDSPAPALAFPAGNEQTGYWDKGFQDIYKTLLMNLNMPNSYFDTRYAWPAPTFRSAYLWDTAFISQVWKPWDVKVAQEVNRAVIDHADQGRLPHFANPHSKSDYTQPPVMTWSVWENFLWSGDRDYLAHVYPALKNYNRWYYENRRLECGLFFWVHSYESGIDNSPRFSSRDEKVKKDLTRIAAVDVNSYIVRQNQTLALIARELGKVEDARKFQEKAEELRSLVNSMMWDDGTGYYYDLDVVSGELVKIKTIASLFPLFAGIPDQERAQIIRGHVMDPDEFNTPFPLPSTALNDPTFEKDCWRGPIWINTAYMVIVGMERYGFTEDAASLSFKLVEGIYKTYDNTNKFVEFYDPERYDFKELSRKKGNLFKLLQNGNKPKPQFVGWTGLANTLVIEHLVGFKKDRGKIRIAPNFPEMAQGLSGRLTLPAEGLEIEFQVLTDGSVRVKIIDGDRCSDIMIQRGESFLIE
jgi:glycogen debranching enzyme